ncbi:hypothetical protein [Aulosira sp. FACHB-615]|uniref:hypothetical protein n=1 Tax=Aulosira sp. FACHB-615 TaxID=2692777 RepID=UPI001687D20A|nr:hypothetical protein [Aulosira sp. FACHB-615]MBD2491886.1 hypothetical protein [Aulosira sp. FACHB-615]
MFNAFEAALYQGLQDFKLHDPSHEFGFTRHLMKNHGWTLTYPQKAIAVRKNYWSSSRNSTSHETCQLNNI